MATSLTNFKLKTMSLLFIITSSETWVHHYSLEMQVESMVWKHYTSCAKTFDNCEQQKVMGAICEIFTGLFLFISGPLGGTGTTIAVSQVSDFGLSFRVGYISSARLPHVALLSLDIINVGLPHVALLFLIIIKCSATVPN
jgi:hypothetical protein